MKTPHILPYTLHHLASIPPSLPQMASSNSQLLEELESLSKSLYPARRTASIALPRPSDASLATSDATGARADHHSRSRRISFSPWRSRPEKEGSADIVDGIEDGRGEVAAPSTRKKGIWSWKPMRALSHISMRRLGCLFSMQVVAIRGLPASMNGLRLAAAVRKKETRDGAVQTMPSRVLQGSADFEETLFIRCHVYCTGGGGTGKPLKLEPRQFVVSAVAIDAPEVDMGRNTVDLSLLIRESVERSLEGMRIHQWDKNLKLSGKAMGGQLVLKLGFQIMDDGGVGIYSQPRGASDKGMDSFFHARKQSKSSFSIASARFTRAEPSAKEVNTTHSMRMEYFNTNEPEFPSSSSPSYQNSEPEVLKTEEQDFPGFEVVEKGVEVQTVQMKKEAMESAEKRSVLSEIVKEALQDPTQQIIRLTELDSIEKQIMALESTMAEDVKRKHKNKIQQLDAEEETVTREFLQMLDLKINEKESKPDMASRVTSVESEAENYKNGVEGVFLSDLGKTIGSVIQTKDGGHLISINPFDVEVLRKETPKLAMQISRPFVLQDQNLASAFEVFQRLAAMGSEEMASRLFSLASMDELMGKTAEQIAFEGVASAIISGRNKEQASSSAARSIMLAKTMAAAMSEGRKERILTGIWNMKEEPVPLEETLVVSLQKMEAMAVEAVKIQADMAEEEAPFAISPHIRKEDCSCPLDSTILLDDLADTCSNHTTVTMLVMIQLRDPLRRYEAVGAPIIAMVQAARVDDGDGEEVEGKFKMTSLHVGGLKLRLGGKTSNWDGEKQRLTATQWLVAYGMGKPRKKNKLLEKKAGQDLLWSISSRVIADMWLNSVRNPDVKVPSEYHM